MKIAYVLPRYAPDLGGVETHVTQLAGYMAAHGHSVEVLTQSANRSLPSTDLLQGVHVRRFPITLPSQHYAVAPGLWTYLRHNRSNYDVVHAHNYHALPALGAALTGCRPLVFTPHYHGTSQSAVRRALHVAYRAWGHLLLHKAASIICDSDAEAMLVRSHFPQAVGRIRVILLGVDVRTIRAAEPYPLDRTTVLSVGRLETYKNVHRVIEAFAHLDESFVLRVVGSGPARPALEALTVRLGLADRVEFLGRVDDDVLHRWLRTAAVTVSLSTHEAYGLTLVEALAAKASIVVSDIPSYREIAERAGTEVAELVAEGASPATLAQVLRRMARRHAHHSMPEAAIPSIEMMGQQTLQVYNAVAC